MERVSVIGCPGSGKSTFSRVLRDKTGLPLYYLDMLYHKPDRSTISMEEFDRKLDEILRRERFILDGNYGRTLDRRLERCDTVFFLDYPTDICLEGIAARRGKAREDMPWIETEPDEEFVRFVERFRSESRPGIIESLSRFPLVHQIVFHSRDEADRYLL